MSSRKFELVKAHHAELASLLDRLWEYIRQQRGRGQTFFVPKLAAAFLHLNDGEAYVLLELLASEGVLSRAFNVYCKATGELLATVSSEADLKNVPHCDECDADHDGHELRLEIAFELPSSDDMDVAA